MDDTQSAIRSAAIALWVLLLLASFTLVNRLNVTGMLNDLRLPYLLSVMLDRSYSVALIFPCDPTKWQVHWTNAQEAEFLQDAGTCELTWIAHDKSFANSFFGVTSKLDVASRDGIKVVAPSDVDKQSGPYETQDSLRMKLIGNDGLLLIGINPSTTIRQWLRPLSNSLVGQDMLLFASRLSYVRGVYGDTDETRLKSVIWSLNIRRVMGAIDSVSSTYGFDLHGAQLQILEVYSPGSLLNIAQVLKSTDFLFVTGVLRNDISTSQLSAMGPTEDDGSETLVEASSQTVDRIIRYGLLSAGFSGDKIDDMTVNAIWKVQSQTLQVPWLDFEIDLRGAAVALIAIATLLGAWLFWNLDSLYRARASLDNASPEVGGFVASFREMRALLSSRRLFNICILSLLIMMNFLQVIALILPLVISITCLAMIYLPTPVISDGLPWADGLFGIAGAQATGGLSAGAIFFVALAVAMQLVAAIAGAHRYLELGKYGWST